MKAAWLTRHHEPDWGDDVEMLVLKVGYSEEDCHKFLNLIDFEYDSGYGGQEVFGVIWYEGGTWSSRGEYDGSEWWEHNVIPEIPAECI